MKFQNFSDKFRHLNLERRELERKWRLKREEDMLLEAISQKSKGSNNAPGVGGGGGGGQTATAASQLMVLNERDASTFTYYVFNYDAGTVSGPHDTGLSVDDYDFNNSEQDLITKGGYVHKFYNSSNNDYAMLFIDAGGNLLKTVIGNTSDLTIYSIDGKYILAWDYDLATVWAFDGTKVLTDTTTFVGVDAYGTLEEWDETTSDGFVMYSITNLGDGNNEHKLYLGTASGITPIFTETASTDLNYYYYCRYNSDKIIIRVYDNNTGFHIGFKVIDSTGNIVRNIELAEDTYTDHSIERFGTDKFFVFFYNYNDNTVDYNLYCYDMTNDTLLQTNVSRETYPSFNTEFDTRTAPSGTSTQFSENALFVFYNQTGSGYSLSEVNYLKYVGYFATESDFVIADFADDETKYVSTGGYLTSDVFLIPVDNAGAYSMLIFDSSGTLSYEPLGIDSGDQRNVNGSRSGSNLFFRFMDDFDEFYYIYVIKSDASAFYLLEEEIEDFHNERERDTILVRDNINNLAWYFNSVSMGWISTNPYSFSKDTTNYTRPDRVADGNVASSFTNRTYYFNDMAEFSNYSIGDGGDNMYNSGNIINTNIATEIIYTHTQMPFDNDKDNNEAVLSDFIMDGEIVTSDAEFGVGSSYFTNLYPGLFVMSASDVDITDFSITGSLGADGYAQADNYEYTPTGFEETYKAYIKRVYFNFQFDINQPSINHIIIVNTDGTGITQTVDLSTQTDNHELTGLGDVTKVHYLLFAKANGTKATEEEIENIINSYLAIVDNKSLSDTLADLNDDYSTITENLPPRDSPEYLTIYRRTSVSEIEIDDAQDISLGKDIFAYWYYDTDRENKITVKLYNYAGTLLQTIETGDELMSNFDVVENRAFLSTYTKYFDPIIYYTYNFHHLCSSGKSTITKDILDNNADYDWLINDYSWWD
jgi:hypothetical protein